MNVVVTCGPSYEPIDGARRITNFSTGRLGISLSNALTERGWRVCCLKGEMASCPDPVRAQRVESFSTNQDLAERLGALARAKTVDAVLHAAALCDFRVERALDEAGQVMSSPKFTTTGGRLRLELAPTIKVLPLLREWFPSAILVGWKYELAGTRAEAIGRAFGQIQACHTDACVLNGAAYGAGFGVCLPEGKMEELPDAPALAGAVIRILEKKRP